MIKRYSEMIQLKTFEERFDYLKLDGFIGRETFGGSRYLNQILYRSAEWKPIRRKVIIRDCGCDLADPDRPIFNSIIIHHINPITVDDIINRNVCVFDLENLVCTTLQTHNAIHYGNSDSIIRTPIDRRVNDTCPWK